MKHTPGFFLSLLVFFLLTIPETQAQPAWSRGIQVIKGTHGDLMQRAENSLLQEGYSIQSRGNDYVAGQKDIHSAIITVNAASGENVFINIFVASNNVQDGGIPGIERQRLQGRMDGSLTGNNPTTPTVIQADWNTQADMHRGKNGQRFTYIIPPNGRIGRIWGTDVYTDDSSVGTCAVHAGLISFERGGTVTIEIRPSQTSYVGSTRNGITSNGYGSWHGSFVFVR